MDTAYEPIETGIYFALSMPLLAISVLWDDIASNPQMPLYCRIPAFSLLVGLQLFLCV